MRCAYTGSADVRREDGRSGHTGTRTGHVEIEYVPDVLADDGHRPHAVCARVRGLDPDDAALYGHNSHAIAVRGPMITRSNPVAATAWRVFAERLAGAVEAEAMPCP